MDFLDLFAGIGGFRMGLEHLGHHCVGFCEIDKFARASYKAIYHTEGEVEFHDITKLKAYYLTTKGELLEQSSPRLMNWGMMQNGRYLTQKISEFPKTESECSLSDILEEEVNERYFLSEERAQQLILANPND